MQRGVKELTIAVGRTRVHPRSVMGDETLRRRVGIGLSNWFSNSWWSGIRKRSSCGGGGSARRRAQLVGSAIDRVVVAFTIFARISRVSPLISRLKQTRLEIETRGQSVSNSDFVQKAILEF